MKSLVCKCCGGKIDRSTMTCLYCDTAYLASEGYFEEEIMTPNEVRAVMGLRKSQIMTEALYSDAIKALANYTHEY